MLLIISSCLPLREHIKYHPGEWLAELPKIVLIPECDGQVPLRSELKATSMDLEYDRLLAMGTAVFLLGYENLLVSSF